MYMNPYLSSELARERQREMLAHAQRPRRSGHNGNCTGQRSQRPARRLRRAVRTAARLRAAFQS